MKETISFSIIIPIKLRGSYMENKQPLDTFPGSLNSRGLEHDSLARKVISGIIFEFLGSHFLSEVLSPRFRKRSGHWPETTVYRTLKLLCDAGVASGNPVCRTI